MFGLLRITLAVMVTLYHLYFGFRYLPLGSYAVFGFYVISGYLMTLIMHESYGYTRAGKLSFISNRFLRLYPQYWAAAIFSLSIILLLGPEVMKAYHPSMRTPNSIQSILSNSLMMFTAWYPNSVNPRLVPPTWALTVELFFYLLICLGVSKNFTRINVWLLFSLSYVALTYYLDWGWQARYFPVAAASLPFAIGSAVYFLSKRENLSRMIEFLTVSPRLLFLVLLGNCSIWMSISGMGITGGVLDLGFYINIVICGLLVLRLAQGGKIFNINKHTDKVIGDYAYPIYLLHWQCGLLSSYFVFGEPLHEFTIRGFLNLIPASLCIGAISFAFIRIIDRPIEKNIRAKIKRNI